MLCLQKGSHGHKNIFIDIAIVIYGFFKLRNFKIIHFNFFCEAIFQFFIMYPEVYFDLRRFILGDVSSCQIMQRVNSAYRNNQVANM